MQSTVPPAPHVLRLTRTGHCAGACTDVRGAAVRRPRVCAAAGSQAAAGISDLGLGAGGHACGRAGCTAGPALHADAVLHRCKDVAQDIGFRYKPSNNGCCEDSCRTYRRDVRERYYIIWERRAVPYSDTRSPEDQLYQLWCYERCLLRCMSRGGTARAHKCC